MEAAGAPPAALDAGAIDQLVLAAAQKYNLPPDVLRNLLLRESGANPGVTRGAAGEVGIAQFMPGTAAALGIDPSDPKQAIPGAALYLRQNVDRFGGDLDTGLAAYNWGPGNVAKYGLAGAPQSVRNYVTAVRGAGGRTPGPPGTGGQPTPGSPGAVGATSPATANTPLANAVAPDPAQQQALAALLSSGGLGGGQGGLGTMMANAATNWQKQLGTGFV